MRPSCLENVLQLGYTYGVVDSLEVSFKSTRPPGKCDPEFGLRARSSGPLTWRNMSLRHVSLREMGWSRNPTSSGFAPAKPESKGKASAAFAGRTKRRSEHSEHTPSLLHRKQVLSADA